MVLLICLMGTAFSFAANLDTVHKRRAGASWLRGVPGMGGYGPKPGSDLTTNWSRIEMAGDYPIGEYYVPPGFISDNLPVVLLLLEIL